MDVFVCLLGRDEGNETASAETQSHREGQSESQAGESNRENEKCGREIGGRKELEGTKSRQIDKRKKRGKRENWLECRVQDISMQKLAGQ